MREEKMRKNLKEKLWILFEKELIKNDLLLFDFELRTKSGQKTIEIIIDKEKDYVSVDDCVKATNLLTPIIEEQELFADSYNIEVSSPGLERKLRDERDFIRFKNQTIKIILKTPYQKRSVIIGKNEDFCTDKKILTISEKDTNIKFEVQQNDIKEARLYLEV